ncbi:putative indole-3-pyruvate monooxygenase [Escovopsis weberi]|uniref:Putative indole-3-pyruvate monooxygenase n=1 Tax=Escovopsis weberi TaxID=150374 RepID=A0A0M9VU29_ESCWE|nr:putative indole-3-pyruvate monooxygenase [Escovopsis weberi]
MVTVMLAERSPDVPAWNKTMPGSVNIRPAVLPAPSNAAQSPELDVFKVAVDVLGALDRALSSADFDAASKLFRQDGFWRDHLALSWDFRTLHSPPAIADFLKQCAGSKDGFRLKSLALDKSTERRMPTLAPLDTTGLQVIQFFFVFETVVGTGRGVARLADDNGAWKIYTIHTSLRELKGHEESLYERRPTGVQHGAQPGRRNWAERRAAEIEFQDGNEPVVLVLGAGQAGLTIAARLKMMGVNALIVDKNDRVGDNWRKRYHQLVLHDPVWYDHLPYMPFPPHWPIFTPKDKLAQWFEAYVDMLELNVWMKTDLTDSKYDDATGEWTVTLTRRHADGSTEVRTVRPRHIVQATGASGKKNMPDIEGIDGFQGDRLCHSSEFAGARSDGKGKKAVIVGSCNSANDIAQDLTEKGYEVTLVQRSSTHIVTSKAVMDIALKGIYSEDGPPVEDADLLMAAVPMAVLKAIQTQVVKLQAEHDKEVLSGLARAGFRVDSGPDGAGTFFAYFQSGGGYYIDVGSSRLIIDGRVKVKQGVSATQVLPHGLRFSDGSELEADEIIFATGYQNMRMTTRMLFGDEAADRIGDAWGLDKEGEFRGIWRRSGHPGLWLHGGNLALCRQYSKLLALQIKGLEAGLFKYDEK